MKALPFRLRGQCYIVILLRPTKLSQSSGYLDLLLRAIWRYIITGMHHALARAVLDRHEKKANRSTAILSAGAR